MSELNEQALVEALAAIAQEPKHTSLPKLLATEEGIATALHRFETEPEFRADVRALAAEDPAYRAFCMFVGIPL